MDLIAKPNWYTNQVTLVEVAGWMDSTGYFLETSDVLRFFEKPYNYEYEYKVWLFFCKEDTKCPECGQPDECSCYHDATDTDEYLTKLEDALG